MQAQRPAWAGLERLLKAQNAEKLGMPGGWSVAAYPPKTTTKGRIVPLFARDRLVCNVQAKMVGLAKSVRHEHIPALEDPLTGEFFLSASLAIEDGEKPFPQVLEHRQVL